MSAKPSKQLGALLGRVPAATAGGQGVPSVAPAVPYASPSASAAQSMPAAPAVDREVPLQVLIPEHVRVQLDQKRLGRERKSIRQVVLEALRDAGYTISPEDIAGKRGLKNPKNNSS